MARLVRALQHCILRWGRGQIDIASTCIWGTRGGRGQIDIASTCIWGTRAPSVMCWYQCLIKSPHFVSSGLKYCKIKHTIMSTPEIIWACSI